MLSFAERTTISLAMGGRLARVQHSARRFVVVSYSVRAGASNALPEAAVILQEGVHYGREMCKLRYRNPVAAYGH